MQGNQRKQSFSAITPISSVYSPIFHIISKLTLSQILKNGLRFVITNGQNSYAKAFLHFSLLQILYHRHSHTRINTCPQGDGGK